RRHCRPVLRLVVRARRPRRGGVGATRRSHEPKLRLPRVRLSAGDRAAGLLPAGRAAEAWVRRTGRGFWLRRGSVCGMFRAMNRQEILDRLRAKEDELRARGVTHAALFGSRARGDSRAESDTDIIIDVDPEAR